MLFSFYTSELSDVISQHLPADDTGIYLAFNPNDDSDQDAAIAAMEACVCDIRSWMINEKLMINDSKTEFMLTGTKAQPRVLTTRGLTSWWSYNQWFLPAGVLQPRVLTTKGLKT